MAKQNANVTEDQDLTEESYAGSGNEDDMGAYQSFHSEVSRKDRSDQKEDPGLMKEEEDEDLESTM